MQDTPKGITAGNPPDPMNSPPSPPRSARGRLSLLRKEGCEIKLICILKWLKEFKLGCFGLARYPSMGSPQVIPLSPHRLNKSRVSGAVYHVALLKFTVYNIFFYYSIIVLLCSIFLVSSHHNLKRNDSRKIGSYQINKVLKRLEK